MGSICRQAYDENAKQQDEGPPPELPVHILFYEEKVHKYKLIATATYHVPMQAGPPGTAQFSNSGNHCFLISGIA